MQGLKQKLLAGAVEENLGLGDADRSAKTGTLTAQQQRQYTDYCDTPGHMVRENGHAVAEKLRHVRITPQRGHPGRGADQWPVAGRAALWAGIAHGAAVEDDDARVDLLEYFVTQTQRFQGAGFEVRQHHVRLCDQLLEQVTTGLAAQVDAQAALIAMALSDRWGNRGAGHGLATAVGESAVFDLDDFGALVGH
ncbi:hypothetical protein D3C76_1139240 [compost metagenome]